MLFQFPSALPFDTQKNPIESNRTYEVQDSSSSRDMFEKIPEGKLGQLRLHQSGKMTLSMGNTIFEVNPGSQPRTLQQVVILDSINKQHIHLGDLKKKFLCVPDMDALLKNN